MCEKHFDNCRNTTTPPVLRSDLLMSDLGNIVAWDDIPEWYINATAHKSRGVIGWAASNARNFDHTMTHNKASSGFHGTVNLPPDMRLLDAVGASAAFLDCNEMALG